MRKILLLVMSIVGLVSPSTWADPPAQGSYRITAGDVLDVIVWRNKDLSMQVTVRPDGWISYPLAGDVRVVDSTVVAVQKTLEEALSKYVNTPMVTVVVSKVSNVRVSILGKVRQPGRYAVEGATTVLDVLALAGGPTEYADPDGIYILRKGPPPENAYERIPARFSSSVSPGKGNTNVTITAGDIVIVP